MTDIPTDVPIKRGRGRPRKQRVDDVSVGQSKPSRLFFVRLRNPRSKRFLVVTLNLSLVIVVALLGWKYMDAQKDLKRLTQQTPKQVLSQNTARDELIQKVSKITVVPTDERPTVGEISDVSNLPRIFLFEGAQVGDKVLSYAKARRQVVYRPSTNQVITAITLPDNDSANSSPSQ